MVLIFFILILCLFYHEVSTHDDWERTLKGFVERRISEELKKKSLEERVSLLEERLKRMEVK
nr:MAG TPA: zipper dimerization domain transcription factor-like protein [Caudoviricetes sp.]